MVVETFLLLEILSPNCEKGWIGPTHVLRHIPGFLNFGDLMTLRRRHVILDHNCINCLNFLLLGMPPWVSGDGRLVQSGPKRML